MRITKYTHSCVRLELGGSAWSSTRRTWIEHTDHGYRLLAPREELS